MGDKLIMSKKELRRKSILDLVKAKTISQKDASIRLNVSYRQTKRIYQRYLKEGDEGLIHKSRGKPSQRAYPLAMKEAILKLYKEKYGDFGPTLASEKLNEDDGYRLHAETLRLWLKQAGLWQSQRKRKAYRSRRTRRHRFGELLQMDGSIHAWFSGRSDKSCLMNVVDDATGKTLSLLDTGETTSAALRLLKSWIELHGIPMAIYVDLKSLYISPKSLKEESDSEVEPQWLTHFSRACARLGIEIIKAYSPQAKGRVERSHAVYQDRFVKELRLKGINDIEGANKVLMGGFIEHLNEKFMKAPASEEDAHIGLTEGQDLNELLCWTYTRKVSNDWVVRFENQHFQIDRQVKHLVRRGDKVTVKKHLDGHLSLWKADQKLRVHLIEPIKAQSPPPKKGYDTHARSMQARRHKHKTPWSHYNENGLSHPNRRVATTS